MLKGLNWHILLHNAIFFFRIQLKSNTTETMKLLDCNPLSANPEKWSNTLKQIVGKLPTICLSVFDHFSGLALKALRFHIPLNENSLKRISA